MTNHSFLPASVPLPDFTLTILAPLLALAALIAVLFWLRHPKSTRPKTNMAEVLTSLTSEMITQRFLASIPQVTRQLNLELATSTQTEVFEAAEQRTLLRGLIDLGTNHAHIHAPVTYRYHLSLAENGAWN